MGQGREEAADSPRLTGVPTDDDLIAASRLEKLAMFHCKGVTDAGIDTLAEMLPDCEL